MGGAAETKTVGKEEKILIYHFGALASAFGVKIATSFDISDHLRWAKLDSFYVADNVLIEKLF